MAFITIKMYTLIMINSCKYGWEFYGINKKTSVNNKRNAKKILKLYINFWIIILLFVVLLGYLTGSSATYPGNIKTLLYKCYNNIS